MTEDEERTLARELHARAEAIAVPWVQLRHRRPIGSRVAVFAALAAVLVAAVLAGGALNARRLSAVVSQPPGASPTSLASPTARTPSALTPIAPSDAVPAAIPSATAGPFPNTPSTGAPSASVSGRVVKLLPGGAVVESAASQVEISLGAAQVWKETLVPASALAVGDDVFVTGGSGSPFVARYVWANIGRVDGVIREMGATDMLVDVQLRQGGTVAMRIEFSPYVEFGSADGTVTLRQADLVVGRAISVVIYTPPGGTPRATRVW